MEKFLGKKNIAVFISGRGSNLKSLINYSKKKNSLIKIMLVISNNTNAKGLKIANSFKIKNYAIKFKNRSIFEKQSLKLMKKYNIDMICLAGFMKIVSGNFIKKFANPILNIHPSLLPKYKGLNTHQRTIDNKEKYSGFTVHLVNKKLDSGKIIFQKKLKIFINDTANILEKRIRKFENKHYPLVLSKYVANL